MHDPSSATPWQEVAFGPAACMLLDREKVASNVKWCTHLGLANGWLGGDFEEVEYARRLVSSGKKLYRATRTLFHHRGGRTTHEAFDQTDRCAVIGVIKFLLKCQESSGYQGDDWWSPLKCWRPTESVPLRPTESVPPRSGF